MARFYGVVRGSAGPAARIGSKTSGLQVAAAGWDTGAKVYLDVDDDGRDVVTVYRTKGTNGGADGVVIATWKEGEDG